MKDAMCDWCDAPIKVRDTYNPKKDAIVCSKGCRDADVLFRTMFSDEEINRKHHYDDLTSGSDE